MARPSLLVMAGAALLDYLIGDPPQWLHPVQVMGWGIERYSQWVWARQWPPSREKLAGVGLVVLTVGLTVGATLGCLLIARRVSSVLAVVLETVWVASALAGRSLRRAALEVLEPLQAGDLAQARQALSQYVGRDTAQLPEAEILRAVLETVTENATDGVMAPLFYALVGAAVGPSPAVWALAYKAVSTLDSMVGYRSPPYTHLGWASARLEDGLTWLPCRLVVVTIALLSGRPRYVWRVCCRDAPYDPSPNAGWSECCYAAALGVQMGGVNVYRGVVKVKPKLGDPGRPITPAVVHQALTLNRWCFLTWLALGLLGMLPR
ncbi:MAG: adenosylcobinamide-phosphate synthase CbiB [Gloeomargarita sp. SKYBB_i_bin120]|nr:adenosylcobinamide-phosphate synthase CbiB [Gloeomargarita sp. SKYG98]MCS7292098.1 adenosylcobinamide-phosphate synthase CbiB [Gloeomargarita sp. SKYB120]MDW8177658.1 adenosylcobinamide-phosphate synthase CbiB [Gloeomargarita sp. SKYBB_i_bin120]